MSALVELITSVARREIAADRGLSLGVVTEVFTNEGGRGDHYLDCHVRLHGSALVLQNVQIAVSRPGVSAVPRVGDLVVVGFVEGDINGPIVLGALHADGVPPPDAKPDEIVYEVPDDASSARRMELRLPNGNRVTVKDAAVEIVMGTTTVTVEGDGAIKMEAAGDISLKANGALKLESAMSATLKAPMVTVEASGPAELKGAITTISGLTTFRAG